MKNIAKNMICTAAATMILASLISCEPITKEIGAGDAISSVDQIRASVTQEGNTNKVHVYCSSPVVCQWTDGVNLLTSNEGDLILLVRGAQTIVMTAMAADGKTFTKEFSVNVSDMKYPVDPAYGLLFGSGEKTWVWNTTSGWAAPDGGPAGPLIMCGGSPSSGRDYWGWTPDDMSSQCEEAGVADEGLGAKMVFALSGKKVSKYDPSGKQISRGSLNFDMTPTSVYGSLGTLTFAGTNILYPRDRNGNTEWSFSSFTIAYLDDEHLMLFTPSSNGGWYYVFNAQLE
ncbi:MAG: hypothetical protein LBD35_06475 [Prevotellaceae bacterium]|jgi:hypothetical protein|nr:hypothetical protein [Prevotellaceae bacterium]